MMRRLLTAACAAGIMWMLGFPRHCRTLTQAYETAAKEADGLAKAHQAMADEAARRAK